MPHLKIKNLTHQSLFTKKQKTAYTTTKVKIKYLWRKNEQGKDKFKMQTGYSR